MVFAATAAGILALRGIVGNVADLTRLRKEALQNDTTWTQPDTAIDKPAQDVPKPTTAPTTAPTAEPRTTTPPAESTASAQAASAALASGTPSRWQHSAGMNWCTVRRWATGAPTTARTTQPRQESMYPAKAGKVDSVTEDALWGYVVEITDKNGVTWRYCGLTDTEVKTGDSVTTATAIGKAGASPPKPTASAFAPGVHQGWCVPRPGGAAVMADGKSRSPTARNPNRRVPTSGTRLFLSKFYWYCFTFSILVAFSTASTMTPTSAKRPTTYW